MDLIFIRHGKDDDRYRGGWSQLDLTPEGVEEAKKLALYLKDNTSCYNITKIISSDLQRCVTTAKFISDALSIPVTYVPCIRETNNGLLAGMPNDKALIEYPGLFFSSLDMDERYPCGESPAEFYSRIKLWFDRFTGKSAEDVGNVLVITHGGVINVIYHIVKRLEWSNKTPPFKAANCSIHILNLEKMTFTAENLTDHLKA